MVWSSGSKTLANLMLSTRNNIMPRMTPIQNFMVFIWDFALSRGRDIYENHCRTVHMSYTKDFNSLNKLLENLLVLEIFSFFN